MSASTLDPPAIPRTRRATLTSGVFDDLDNMLGALRALRRVALAATEDVVGLVIPVPADPTGPDALYDVPLPATKPRKFNVLRWVMEVIDPHQPQPDYQSLIKGQNNVLARPLLGDLSGWLVAAKGWRVPIESAPGGGVWVIGRPNHAAALAGAQGAAAGGTFGALATLGLDQETALRYAPELAKGACILTTCETDDGRIKRDLGILQKHGARDLVQRPIGHEERGPA